MLIYCGYLLEGEIPYTNIPKSIFENSFRLRTVDLEGIDSVNIIYTEMHQKLFFISEALICDGDGFSQ
jgi:hypothetical protein